MYVFGYQIEKDKVITKIKWRFEIKFIKTKPTRYKPATTIKVAIRCKHKTITSHIIIIDQAERTSYRCTVNSIIYNNW